MADAGLTDSAEAGGAFAALPSTDVAATVAALAGASFPAAAVSSVSSPTALFADSGAPPAAPVVGASAACVAPSAVSETLVQAPRVDCRGQCRPTFTVGHLAQVAPWSAAFAFSFSALSPHALDGLKLGDLRLFSLALLGSPLLAGSGFAGLLLCTLVGSAARDHRSEVVAQLLDAVVLKQ